MPDDFWKDPKKTARVAGLFGLPPSPPMIETELSRNERWFKSRPRRLYAVMWWCGCAGIHTTRKAAVEHRRALRKAAWDCDVWIVRYDWHSERG